MSPGDTATSESYVHACIRMDENDIVVRGRYLDTWSRRDGSGASTSGVTRTT